MKLEPITIDIDVSLSKYEDEYCKEILQSYPDYYYKTGYNPPWIGYWVYNDAMTVIGVGGFVGAPVNGEVELAYGTRKEYEGNGVATFTCSQLVAIARKENDKIIITAKTQPEENASAKILKRQGFLFSGIVQDHGIGDAWQWILSNKDGKKE